MDKKISQLPTATSGLSINDYIPIVNNGDTKKFISPIAISVDGDLSGVKTLTATTGNFTSSTIGTLSVSTTLSGVGVTNKFASPPAIGSTTPSTGKFTTLTATGALSALSASITGGISSDSLTTTDATISGTISGTAITNKFAAPPAIGSTTPNTGKFSTLWSTSTLQSDGNVTIGSGATPSTLTVYGDSLFNARIGVGINAPSYCNLSTGSGNVSLGMPSDCWTDIGVNSGSTGTNGILYTSGSYRASWSCNGYRDSSDTWKSLGINSNSGASVIDLDPNGTIYLRADSSKATGSSSNPTARITVTGDGNFAFNGGASTNYGLVVNNTTTSGATGTDIRGIIAQTVVGDVTTSQLINFRSVVTSSGLSFVLPTLTHFSCGQGSIGSTSVTNQYGFLVDSSLIGATNNYGFYSNIASGTGRYNFYANGTADNYFNGNILSGTTSAYTLSGSFVPVIQNSGTTSSSSSYGGISWAANASGSHCPSIILNRSGSGASGTHTAVTSGVTHGGLYFGASDGSAFQPSASIEGVSDGNASAGIVPGLLRFRTTNSSGASTLAMAIGASGAIGIGSSAPTAGGVSGTSIRFNNPLTAAGATACYATPDVQATSGTTVIYNASITANATAACDLRYYSATQSTFTAGAAIANQYGFYVNSTLTGATNNNYGFYSNIASGTGRYNFYANGSADNWFSGSVLIGGSGGLGYTTGSGGTVTQTISRTTGVTLNKTNGAITLFSAAGSATAATFTVTNSTVAATDVVNICQKSGTNLYNVIITAVAAGSFNVTFYTTGGTATDAPVFNFAVLKSVTA